MKAARALRVLAGPAARKHLLQRGLAAADVRAVHRQTAMRLKAELQQAQGRVGDATTRAHLAETLALIDEALRAPLIKTL